VNEGPRVPPPASKDPDADEPRLDRTAAEGPEPFIIGFRVVGLGTILLTLAGTLAVGHFIKAPCVHGDWSDGRPFTRLCSTDIVQLLEHEQLSGGRLPYLEPCAVDGSGPCDEYPVLMMWTLRLTAWASGPNDTRFFYWNAVLLWLAAFWITFILYELVGSRALYFAAAPTLALYATFNWDLLAVLLAVAGTLAYLRRRDVWSGGILGLGAATKLFPAMLVVPFISGRLRDPDSDHGSRLALSAAATWLGVNLPFAVVAFAGWWEFFRFSGERPANFDSVWFIACDWASDIGCTETRLVNIASAALFIIGVAVVWTAKAHRDPGFPRWSLAFPILALFLITNKVYSPQYSLWLLPWFALAMPDLRLFLAFETADVAVFVTEFSWFGTLNGIKGGLAGIVPLGAFEAAFLVRALVLLLCVVAWVRRRDAVALPAETSPAGKLHVGMDYS
jgi:Glycosyltransferase family 87